MTTISQPINPRNRAEQIGLVITRGGEVVIGEPFVIEGSVVPEVSKLIGIGGPGNVVIETPDGIFIPFFGNTAGDFIPVLATKVVASHDFPNLGTVTTQASPLAWYGGI